MKAYVLPAAAAEFDLVIAPATPNNLGNVVTNATKVSWTDPADMSNATGIVVGVRLATGTIGTYAYTNPNVPVAATSCLFSTLSPALPTGVSLVAGVQILNAAGGNSAWAESSPFVLAAIQSPVTNVTVS